MCPIRRPRREIGGNVGELVPHVHQLGCSTSGIRHHVDVAVHLESNAAVPGPACSSSQRSKLGKIGQLNEDRKSTRLNSSHSQISYAVFCLKKKKKNEQN